MSKYNMLSFRNRFASADQPSTSELEWFLYSRLMYYFPNWTPESVLDDLVAAGWTPGAILEAILGQAAEYEEDARATSQALVPMDECSLSISARSIPLEAAGWTLGAMQAAEADEEAEAAAFSRLLQVLLSAIAAIRAKITATLMGCAPAEDEFTEAYLWRYS